MITTFGWTAWQKSENKNNGKNTSQAKSAEERVGAVTWNPCKGPYMASAVSFCSLFIAVFPRNDGQTLEVLHCGVDRPNPGPDSKFA
jgi:hypothetical protein